MNVCKRFIEGLKDHNLTHEDIKSWQYIGGIGGKNGRHTNYFNLKFKYEDIEFTPPDIKDLCICGTAICEQCWIVDKKCLVSKNINNILVELIQVFLFLYFFYL